VRGKNTLQVSQKEGWGEYLDLRGRKWQEDEKKSCDNFFDLYCTQNITRAFNLRGMRWREHQWQNHDVTCNDIMTNSHSSLAEWQMLLKEHFYWQGVEQRDNLACWEKEISEICNWESDHVNAEWVTIIHDKSKT